MAINVNNPGSADLDEERLTHLRAVGLLEEAFHLVRLAGGGALAAYYIGALPFVMALLYFIGDMSLDARAPNHLGEASLGLSILFVWMKVWQSVYVQHLGDRLAGQVQKSRPWTVRRVLMVIAVQTAIQPWGLIVLPISIVFLPWSYAFFQNGLCMVAQERVSTWSVVKGSAKQVKLWPGQNHTALIVMALLGIFLAMNLVAVVLVLPGLLKSFLDIDTVFTRGGNSIYNTTLLSAIVAMVYLLLDPMIKAMYALRCFYGGSLQSGADLRSDLGRIRSRRGDVGGGAKGIGIILLCVMLLSGSPAGAKGPASPGKAVPTAAKVSPDQLDRAIRQTIDQPRYTWRTPRPQESGKSSNFLHDIGEAIGKWLDGFGNRPTKQAAQKSPGSGGGSSGRSSGGRSSYGGADATVGAIQALLWGVVILVVCGLAYLLAQYVIARRGGRKEKKKETPVAAKPDVKDENVSADQLPEEGWLGMAEELIASGQLRLALRAMYLACLVHLGQREMIRIARFKSNRDYEGELRRRSHAVPGMAELFESNVTTFEIAWYGMHTVTAGMVESFKQNQQRMARLASGGQGS